MSRKIAEGRLTREEYCDLLQALLTFHRSFDRALAQARHLRGFDGPAFRREEIVLRDLRNLGGRLPIRAPAFLDHLERFLPGWSCAPSVAFVGALHVLERQRRDFLKSLPLLARALHAKLRPRAGLDYWLEHSGHATRRCHALAAWIDRHVVDRERTKELVTGAVQTLRAFAAIHGQEPDPVA